MLGIHSTLRASFSVPELELDEGEARELAKAYADVAAFYPALRMAGNVTAMINLGSVVAIVYGSRISAYKMRRNSERSQRRPQTQNHNVSEALSARPPEQGNGAAPAEKPRVVPDEARKGEIPGVGTIEFPSDHPLMGGRKPH